MEPKIVEKKAIEVIPYYNGIWCTVGGGEPFINQIVYRKWSEDGELIVFMLDSHNFMMKKPEEVIKVVEMDEYIPTGTVEKDQERMGKRPERIK